MYTNCTSFILEGKRKDISNKYTEIWNIVKDLIK